MPKIVRSSSIVLYSQYLTGTTSLTDCTIPGIDVIYPECTMNKILCARVDVNFTTARLNLLCMRPLYESNYFVLELRIFLIFLLELTYFTTKTL